MEHIFTTKSNTKKPLSKLPDIINTEVLIKSVFYVNNLTPNQELNTWCEII